MQKTILLAILMFTSSIGSNAQTGNLVLIEQFTETGCGACAQNDSAFNALINANTDKVAVISYHCYYTLDPFYAYNKAGYDRYAFYQMKDGFPSAMVNGKKPNTNSAHLSYVKEPVINAAYNQPPQFKFNISCTSTGKGNIHSASINVIATALKANPSQNLRLFVVITENNINYEQRYHSKSTNSINEFNHIMRAMLPDTGNVIGEQTEGKINKVKVIFTNDDKEINFKEVRIIVFVQDYETREILGTAVTNDHPFH